jgi:PAS domain S-box-containing protein
MKSNTERHQAFKGPIFRGTIGIAMALTDPWGRFLECNAAWSALLGYTQADLQALDVAALTHPDDRAGSGEMFERLCQHEAPNFIVEKRYLTQAGPIIWCRTHMALLEADSQAPSRLLLMASDITQQRLTEEQQRKNQRLLSMAANVARVSSWTFDSTNQTIFWSEECCILHGRPPGHQPTVEEGIAHYAPEYREMIERAVERCLIHGEPFDFEAELVRVDGQRLWVRAIGESVRDATGTITGFEGAIQDISVQRHHENERHAAASKLGAALQSMSDAFFTLDRDWVITFANQEMSRLLGPTPEEMIGRRVWDLFPDAEHGSFHVFYQRVLDTGVRGKLIEFSTRASLWLEVHAHPTDEGLAVHFQDITQKRKDEAELRLLQACVERMNDMLLITDATPNQPGGPTVVYVNKAFEQITGYRADEIIGKTPSMLQGPKTQRETLNRINAQLKDWKPVREEVLNYTKQGEEFWLELDISPVADATGWYTHWIAIERNVTERKRADEAISEQAALLDKAQDAIWVIDLDARITYWNRSAERIHGWAAGEALGANARSLLYKDEAAFGQCLQSVLETGEWVGEVEHKTCEGKTLLLVSRLTLVRDDAEQPRAILAINTDITQQKVMERQYLRAQRMESIGTLAGGIAHDLNNVLAPILMSIGMLKEDVQDADSLALLRTIEVSAQRGANLIRQVLTFARGVEGKRQEVRLADVLKELEHILSETIPRNIAIQLTVTDDLWPVQGDPTQLHQVLLNLCVNARDAMPTGGRINISAKNVRLDDHYVAMNIDAHVGPYVRIDVEDNGTGIDAAILDKIFDPFFTTKPVGQGTGLGLATTQTIIKSHGGFIRAYSEPNNGTRFRIYLPAGTSAAVAGADDLPAPAVPRGQGQLVLVVDDEDAIRQVTRRALEANGYRVLVAANGALAVALFAQHIGRVDLVLTDMMMPVMDGPATILALRQIRPNVRIIGASGIEHNGMLAQAVGAGLKHFLPKPYTADVLLRTLADALSTPDKPVE